MAPPQAAPSAPALDWVSGESFEEALRAQDPDTVRQVGYRLLAQKALLEQAYWQLTAERRALQAEGARLHERIGDTIRELSGDRGDDDLFGSWDLAGLLSQLIEPCSARGETPPVSPKAVAMAPGAEGGDDGAGPPPRTPVAASASARARPGSLGGAPGRAEEEDTAIGALGRAITDQLSGVWSAFTDGELLSGPSCGRGGVPLCYDPKEVPRPAAEVLEVGHGGEKPAAVFCKVGIADVAAPSFPATGVRRTSEHRPSAAFDPGSFREAGRRPPAFSAAPSVGSRPAASAAVLIEADLQLAGLEVAVCSVLASDRCGEAAARFVAEHCLKPSFEAPLAAFLAKIEADSDEFPVLVAADLMDIRRQHQLGEL